VADLGDGPGGPPTPPPLILVKRKKLQKEEKPAGQVKQNRSSAQGLDPPLASLILLGIEFNGIAFVIISH